MINKEVNNLKLNIFSHQYVYLGDNKFEKIIFICIGDIV
ncbi:hypothetical protein C672_1238 [[Clostridium] bifermentans ATCC 638]|uniref:Uncharacterized protein n=1 Tax=Paraclostridium bifermentans ATCC 638 = DSM 14991 TaxID=1233171 RepID=T4VNE2_PARBF|nr:hypothetical protein C672_1238 [[Clostridium] bifermentans ATCC 638] [Paraclostridium bifermentans ATCC 638 = DSM 14991]